MCVLSRVVEQVSNTSDASTKDALSKETQDWNESNMRRILTMSPLKKIKRKVGYSDDEGETDGSEDALKKLCIKDVRDVDAPMDH